MSKSAPQLEFDKSRYAAGHDRISVEHKEHGHPAELPLPNVLHLAGEGQDIVVQTQCCREISTDQKLLLHNVGRNTPNTESSMVL